MPRFICGQALLRFLAFKSDSKPYSRRVEKSERKFLENKRLKDQNISPITPPAEYFTHRKDADLSSSLLPAAVEPHQRLLCSLDATLAPDCSYLHSLPNYGQPFHRQSFSTRQLLPVLSRRVSGGQVNASLALNT